MNTIPTQLTITQENITEANKRRSKPGYDICQQCPTALALIQLTGLVPIVGIDIIWLRKNENERVIWFAKNPPNLEEAIRNWTGGKEFIPMTVTLDWQLA